MKNSNFLLKAFVAIVAMLSIGLSAFAYSFEAGGVYYNITNSTNKTVEVTSGTSLYSGSVSIPSSVTYNGTTYSVTKIGNSAFYGCSGLTSVSIPNSVTSIGSNAFSGCSALNGVYITDLSAWCKITFGNNVANPMRNCCNLYLNGNLVETLVIPQDITVIKDFSFDGCQMKAVKFHENITSIGIDAFLGCSGLTSVSIPNSVTTIGNYAFCGCENMKTIKLPAGLKTINVYLFAECSNLQSIDIPQSVTAINSWAFKNCSGLTSVTIPNSVTSIGDNAFNGCTGLTEVTIGNSVTSIGGNAFNGCTGLTEVTIGNSVTSMGTRAFYGCTGLKKVNISDLSAWCKINFSCPDQSNPLDNGCDLFLNGNLVETLVISQDITEIKNYAFDGCQSIKNIKFHDKITSIGQDAFQCCDNLITVSIPNSTTTIGGYSFHLCTGLTSVTIGNSVTTIGDNAFSGCTKLTSVTIGKSVTSIGNYAFNGCSGLTGNLMIPNSVTSIGYNAFESCSGLTSVSLPNSITSIANSTFDKCSRLTSVTIPNSVTSIGMYVFNGCSGLTSVTIPNSVTRIAGGAFKDCTGLKEVNISDLSAWCKIGHDAFSNPLLYAHTLKLNGTEVKDLVIPGDITQIKQYAFEGCSSLTSVTIPNSVKSIDYKAFNGCSGLTSVAIPNSVTTIGGEAFNGVKISCVKLPASVTSIGGTAFVANMCKMSSATPPSAGSISDLKTVIVPKGSGDAYKEHSYWGRFTVIEENADTEVEVTVSTPGYMAVDIIEQTGGLAPAMVTKLKVHGKINANDFVVMKSNMKNCYSIDLSDAVCDTIPADAFNGKAFLTEVKLPKGCKVIGNYAFYGCSLADGGLELPQGLKHIGNYAFSSTGVSGNIVFPSSLESMGTRAFYNNMYLRGVDMSACTKMTTIPSYAFASTGVTDAILPETIETIDSYAFDGCSSLEEINMPADLTVIGSYAFRNCSSLGGTLDLTHARSLKTINGYAFYQCGSLEKVQFPTSLTSIGSYAFYNCAKLKQFSGPVYFITPMARYSDLSTLINLTTLGNNAFDLTAIESIILPSSLTSMGQYVFSGCYSLKYADLSRCDKITTLPYCAFNENHSLEVISLPSSLISVSDRAFYNCPKLQNISILAATPPTVANANAFTGVDTENCVLSVPTSSYVDYIISEHWGAFVSLCKGISVEKDENVDDVYFRIVLPVEPPVIHTASLATQQLSSVKAVSDNENEPVEYGALVADGSSVYAKNNGSIKFIINVADGYEVSEVLYNGLDVTGQLVNNTYTTPAVTVKGTLKISTRKATTGIEDVETEDGAAVDAVEVARYDIHGRLLSAPAKGINIVKYSDGTTRKVMVKQ